MSEVQIEYFCGHKYQEFHLGSRFFQTNSSYNSLKNLNQGTDPELSMQIYQDVNYLMRANRHIYFQPQYQVFNIIKKINNIVVMCVYISAINPVFGAEYKGSGLVGEHPDFEEDDFWGYQWQLNLISLFLPLKQTIVEMIRLVQEQEKQVKPDHYLSLFVYQENISTNPNLYASFKKMDNLSDRELSRIRENQTDNILVKVSYPTGRWFLSIKKENWLSGNLNYQTVIMLR